MKHKVLLVKHRNHLYLFLYLAGFLFPHKSFSQRPPNLDLLFSRLRYYDSLPVKTYADDSIATGVIGRLCWEYRLINMDSAVCYCDKAMQIAQKAKYIKGIGLIYNQTAAVYRQKGEFTKALDCHNKALDIWRSFQKTNPAYYNSSIIFEEARSLNNMGIIYEQLGEYTKALDLYIQALRIDESKNNKSGAANKKGNIGNVFLKQNQYDKALEYYFEVIELDKAAPDKNRLAEVYGNMGFAYWKIGETNKAMEYYTKAMEINAGVGNKKLLSENFANIAMIYDEEKKYEQAIDYSDKALKLQEEISDMVGIATVLGNVGAMYLDRGMFVEAEKNLIRAKTIADSIGEKQVQLDIYSSLCSLYIKKEQYHEALIYQQKVMLLKDALFNQKQTAEITRKEVTYYAEKKQDSLNTENDKKIAIEQANKKAAVAEADKKRIFAETEKKIAVAEAKTKQVAAEADKEKTVTESNRKIAIAEAEKKRNQSETDRKIILANAALEKQKLIRNSVMGGSGAIALIGVLGFANFRNKRKKEKALLSLQVLETEMKALRAQMNPHFIFNALGSIQTFLLSHKSEEANTYLLKFSKLMRAVLENSQHSEVPVKDDIEALELYMQLESIRLTHLFTYQFYIDDTIDMGNDTIPPLMLQPFVENAIWHGLQYKPGNGHIDVKVTRQGEYMLCTVQDNGVGRSFTKRIQNNSENNKSLGLKITAERLAILNETKHTNASFEITDLYDNNKEPAGTLVTLKLPYNGKD